MIGNKYKRFIMIFCFFCILVMSAYSKQLVFERTVKNEVTGYDGKFYKENSTVTLFVNEFTSDKDGSKLGFAYAIKSDSPQTPIFAGFLDGSKELNSEQDGGWLIYYEKGESFYIGTIWKNGYKTTVTDRSCFYEFDKKVGYELYFMFCYLKAVNHNLTYENKILYTESHQFWWEENKIALSIKLSEFSDYAKYSKSHGNNPPYPNFKICLFHDSNATGFKIAENLKKGMWKTKSRNSDRGGSGLPQYGEITCYYSGGTCPYGHEHESIEEFAKDYYGNSTKALVIDFAPVAVREEK